jgi:hypothetical protein
LAIQVLQIGGKSERNAAEHDRVMTEKPTDSAASVPEQPSRAGKRSVGGHFEPKVAQAIRVLAAQKDTTVQVVLAQALNDYFQKNGLERLADEQPLPRGAAARQK